MILMLSVGFALYGRKETNITWLNMLLRCSVFNQDSQCEFQMEKVINVLNPKF